jgi:hypothetical protein
MVIKLFSAAACTELTSEPQFFDYPNKFRVRKLRLCRNPLNSVFTQKL